MELLIGAVIGTITSILTSAAVAIFVEYMRRPRLELSVEVPPLDQSYSPPTHGITQMRSLRLCVFNKPLPRFARWMVRAPALECRAAISFHHLDGRNVFGRAMEGRWARSPEPVPLPVVGPGGQHSQILDFTRLTLASRIDIYPGQTETLDIVNRPDNDSSCYGWNNEAYFATPAWRNQNWALPTGRYLVTAVISSSGQEFTDYFHLYNDVRRTDCRLDRANDEERNRLRNA